MSYHKRTSYDPGRRQRRGRPRRAAMHGMGDDLLDFLNSVAAQTGGTPVVVPGSETDCQAKSDAATATLDAQTNDLAKNWAADNGMYTLADMTRLRDQTMALLLSASQALDAAVSGATTDMIANIRQAQDNIYAKESDSLKYTNTINDAAAKGIQQISSSDFKDWVINSMNKASVGLGFAAYINCSKSNLLAAAVSAFQTAWDALVATVKGLVKFAIDTAKLVAKVPDTASDILDYLKYAAFAVGGYWLFQELKKVHR